MFMIDPTSKTSISYQLEKQLINFISIGILNENDQLPSVHSLANECGINQYFVLKAYKKLELKGYVHRIDEVWFVNHIIDNKNSDKVSEFTRFVFECHELGIEKIRLVSNTERIYKGGAKYAED